MSSLGGPRARISSATTAAAAAIARAARRPNTQLANVHRLYGCRIQGIEGVTDDRIISVIGWT